MPRVASPRLSTPAKAPPPLKTRRPSRFSLLWRRKRKLLWPVAGLLAVGALVVLGASTVRSFRHGSSVASLQERLGLGAGLTVHDIRIEGREKTPEPLLRAALGVSPGDKLLGFSLEAARARIEGLTWVQRATVERRLPGTVVVMLEERRPFAVWQNNGKFVLIDRNGQVVVQQDPGKDATAFATLPLVVGPGAPESAAALLDLLTQFPAVRSRVVAAVRVSERRWNLRLNNGADVLLPEGAELAALNRLSELQNTQAVLDRPVQALDMRLPDRLVVRPMPEPRPPASTGPRRPT